MKVKSNLHLTDNEKVDSTDALYKIRPLINKLKKISKNTYKRPFVH